MRRFSRDRYGNIGPSQPARSAQKYWKTSENSLVFKRLGTFDRFSALTTYPLN